MLMCMIPTLIIMIIIIIIIIIIIMTAIFVRGDSTPWFSASRDIVWSHYVIILVITCDTIDSFSKYHVIANNNNKKNNNNNNNVIF